MKITELLESINDLEKKIDELSFRKSIEQPGKTFKMNKLVTVDESNNHLEEFKWENFRYYDYEIKKTINVKDLHCIIV